MHLFLVGLVAFSSVSPYPLVCMWDFIASRADLICVARHFAIGAKGTEKQQLVTFLKKNSIFFDPYIGVPGFPR